MGFLIPLFLYKDTIDFNDGIFAFLFIFIIHNYQNDGKLVKKMTKNQDNISEIRVEEVHDHEDGKHFYRVYFHYKNGKIKIMGESKTKPILARYVSKIY